MSVKMIGTGSNQQFFKKKKTTVMKILFVQVASFNTETKCTLEGLVHFTKFVELGNDLNIVDGLIDPKRVSFCTS